MRRSQSDIVTGEISDDVLSALYETSIVVKNAVEEGECNSLLISSIGNKEATIEAAVHIGYLLTEFNKKILIMNLDLESPDILNQFLAPDKEAGLITQLKNSAYISDSIARSQYENLDFIGIEETDEEDFVAALNKYDLKSKLRPLSNYYDLVMVVGPEAENFNYYANIMELADSALTVVNRKNNNRTLLKAHIDKYMVFNIRSFGIIRKDN